MNTKHLAKKKRKHAARNRRGAERRIAWKAKKKAMTDSVITLELNPTPEQKIFLTKLFEAAGSNEITFPVDQVECCLTPDGN